jgi:hypothetical protein
MTLRPYEEKQRYERALAKFKTGNFVRLKNIKFVRGKVVGIARPKGFFPKVKVEFEIYPEELEKE